MTPKEKAEELVEKFDNVTNHLYLNNYSDDTAKQCALICVDEMLKVLAIDSTVFDSYRDTFLIDDIYDYYEQVKQELENI